MAANVRAPTISILRAANARLRGIPHATPGLLRSRLAGGPVVKSRSKLCLRHSYAALRRRPNELMHLQLKTRLQIIAQQPIDDFPRFDPTENRRKQNGVTAGGKIVLAHFLPRPFVILA